MHGYNKLVWTVLCAVHGIVMISLKNNSSKRISLISGGSSDRVPVTVKGQYGDRTGQTTSSKATVQSPPSHRLDSHHTLY